MTALENRDDDPLWTCQPWIKSYCETLLDCATNIAQLFGRIAKLLRRIAKLFGRIAKLFLRN